LLDYWLRTGNTADPLAFARRLRRLLPEDKENTMSIAEQLERIGWEKGRVEGWEKGRTEGWEEGRAEGEAAVLARLLTRRFGPLPEWARERLRRADAAQLELWTDAVLEAASLVEVVGAPPHAH
jgi:flagellar biosynthesis/type III secretory pathway protein FliH